MFGTKRAVLFGLSDVSSAGDSDAYRSLVVDPRWSGARFESRYEETLARLLLGSD